VQHSKNNTRPNPQAKEPADESGNDDRRRLGRIVHDDRGNALVQWEEAPSDYERPVLEIEQSGIRRGLSHRLGADKLSLDPQSFDPYASAGPLERQRPPSTGSTSRTDLRKLSEWIKMMRELEQRKQHGDSEEDGE
jgi:hypothetical protein